MISSVPGRLAGWEFHGFHTKEDLNFEKIKKEATIRWLRPNEVHAILCNYFNFNFLIHRKKPVNLPIGGTIVLYDRKLLRNFRKDGHNWKKKKNGKAVNEAHEHLKVGDQERLHVYYAHGQDIPNFARRSYWLLDKEHEHIVLVHYREVFEQHGSPGTHINSKSCASYSDTSVSRILPEETESAPVPCLSGEPIEIGDNMTMGNDHERRLHEINTLEWEDLLESIDPAEFAAPILLDDVSCSEEQNQCEISVSKSNGNLLPSYNMPGEMFPVGHSTTSLDSSVPMDVKLPISANPQTMNSAVQTEDFESAQRVTDTPSTMSVNDSFQDKFNKWMDNVVLDSPVSFNNLLDESSVSTCDESNTSMMVDYQQNSIQEQLFCITDVSPAWAFSTDKTKVVAVGYFHGAYSDIAESSVFCVFGDVCVPAERVQSGVYRCMTSPRTPGFVNFYLSLDGHTPISQVLTFEYRSPLMERKLASSNEKKTKREEILLQVRLSRLLLSTTTNILSSKSISTSLKVAKEFSLITCSIDKDWENLKESIERKDIPFSQAQISLSELNLKKTLKEWLLERAVDGCTISIRDPEGQGVIHLCSMLGYTWAIQLYSRLGLLLDFRDAFGWTALHWAAFYGRKEMVAVLLLEGADPSLVTDPTSEFPGGCTAADIAAKSGHDGLAAYLAQKCLTAHLTLMSLSGNVTGSLKTDTSFLANPGNLSDEQLCLRDTFVAYNIAADAASRIRAAFLNKSLMLQTQVIQHTELEACNIIAAMKIQNAFRNYEIRKKMKSAARIQHRFRTWKIRKDFLDLRWRAIKIQAAFRGHKMRKQYQKIIWSVGVLEKALLRWRQKRKGFRGLQLQMAEAITVIDQNEENDLHEDFYRVSRKQARERIERSVLRVQNLFQSYLAQQEYRTMKLTYEQAKFVKDSHLESSTGNQ